MEGPGELGRLLADHRIHHQQHLVGLAGLADAHHLLHHRLVDLEAPGGVHQHGVEALGPGLVNSGRGDVFRFGLGAKAEHLHADLGAEGFELLDGRRPVDVCSHQQGLAPLLLEVQAELGGGGGFAGALQAGHQHHRGCTGLATCGQGGVLAAHGFNQLLVHQLDKFLIRANAPHHLGAHGLAANLFNEVLNYRQAHICLQQGSTHLLERPLHVGFGD